LKLHITVFFLLFLWTGTDLLHQTNVFSFSKSCCCSYSLGKNRAFGLFSCLDDGSDGARSIHRKAPFKIVLGWQGFRMVLELIKIPWIQSDVHSDHSSNILQNSVVHNDLLLPLIKMVPGTQTTGYGYERNFRHLKRMSTLLWSHPHW